jgi:hypothetical protein
MFCAFMLVQKFHLIAWLELDSNLFEFNRFEFELEKEKGKEIREAVQPRQPGLPLFFPLGRPFFAQAHSLPLSFFLSRAQPARSPHVASVVHLLLHLALGPSTPEAQQRLDHCSPVPRRCADPPPPQYSPPRASSALLVAPGGIRVRR